MTIRLQTVKVLVNYCSFSEVLQTPFEQNPGSSSRPANMDIPCCKQMGP